MKNNLTELVFILDRSGSMSGFESDTVGGFNSMIQKQKKETGGAFVTAILFDNESEIIFDRVDIKEIRKMSVDDYTVRGCTALYDALGDAIEHISKIHHYVREEDVPEHTVFVITTDGMENASHRYTKKHIKELIERKKESFGWEFVFLAANIDAEETAEDIGIPAENSANYSQTKKGFKACYESVDRIITMKRRGVKNDGGAWKKDLEKK